MSKLPMLSSSLSLVLIFTVFQPGCTAGEDEPRSEVPTSRGEDALANANEPAQDADPTCV
jgi:hypothetical protein